MATARSAMKGYAVRWQGLEVLVHTAMGAAQAVLFAEEARAQLGLTDVPECAGKPRVSGGWPASWGDEGRIIEANLIGPRVPVPTRVDEMLGLGFQTERRPRLEHLLEMLRSGRTAKEIMTWATAPATTQAQVTARY